MMNFFKDLALNGSFLVAYNLLPHFAPQGQEYSLLTGHVKEALSDGRIRTFFLSDRPARQQYFSSLQLAEDILAAGGEPVVSLALTFHDRNSALLRLQQYYTAGVRHFIMVSGDYPPASITHAEKPACDIDSVQLLMLTAGLHGVEHIVSGCAVSPFKTFESEQIWQYEKLKRKISVGADFIVTQPGYNMRKFDELLRFCRLHKITAPLMANILIADSQTAKLIEARTIPGLNLSGGLLRALHEESTHRQAPITRTAKIMTVLRGIGYDGVLIGSHSQDFTQIKEVLDRAERYQPDWQYVLGQLNYTADETPFYYFQKNPQNGLNSNKPAPVSLKHFPSPAYSFSYFIDWLVYVPQGPLYTLTGRFCLFCNSRKFWYSFIWLLEYISKGILYGCKMCGDCTLYACGFLCYQAGCPKKMVNGPCGGSIDGYCEVFPAKKKCYWVKVYHNMKGVQQHVTFTAPPVPAGDPVLNRTSSWINYFLGKDHRKMKFKDY